MVARLAHGLGAKNVEPIRAQSLGFALEPGENLDHLLDGVGANLAAPLHHEDEELHVFPPLLAQEHDAPLVTLVRQLQRDHVRMAERWATARGPLQAMADGQLPAFSAEHEAALDGFAECYADHLRHEDDSIYPAARALLDPGAQSAMGQEMARRRGVR